MTDLPPLATLLARMTVRALSPDRLIRAEIRARAAARVAITAPDPLASYRDTTALATQLSAAVSSAAAAADKGRAMLIAQHTRLAPVGDSHWDGRVRRFQQSAASLSAEGVSPRKVVRVTTTGPLEWRVHVVPGSSSRLDSAAFCGEVNAAIAEAARRHAEALYALRRESFPA